jgi:hypothetical protein
MGGYGGSWLDYAIHDIILLCMKKTEVILKRHSDWGRTEYNSSLLNLRLRFIIVTLIKILQNSFQNT